MMEVLARYLEDSKFEVAAGSHRVLCDQPIENGGSDEGMSPPEFLLASVSTCAAYYASQYMNTRQTACRGLESQSQHGKGSAAGPAWHRSILRSPPLSWMERHQAGILRAVNACLIHNTLLGGPSIEIAVNAAELARV